LVQWILIIKWKYGYEVRTTISVAGANEVKTKKIIYLTGLCYVVVIFLLVSCLPDYRNKPRSTEVETTATTPYFKYTLPIPTPTSTQSASPKIKDSATPTQIPILTSTLSQEEIRGAIESFLKGTDGCMLPCLWEITPGKSTWKEAKALFDRLGINVSNYPNAYGVAHYPSYNYVDKSLQISGNFLVFEEKGMVTFIQFSTGYLAEFKKYSLTEILRNYGTPDDVGIDLSILGPSGLPDEAHILVHLAYGTTWLHLYYDQVAFITKDKTSYLYCPNDPRQHTSDEKLVMLVQSKDAIYDRDALSARMDGMTISVPNSIEIASDVTVDEFYKNIIDGNKDFCLVSPVKFWKQYYIGE
jgi:hypothetical protein